MHAVVSHLKLRRVTAGLVLPKTRGRASNATTTDTGIFELSIRYANDLATRRACPFVKARLSLPLVLFINCLNAERFGGNSRMHKHGEENHTIIQQERYEAHFWVRAHPASAAEIIPPLPAQSNLSREGLESARSQSTGRVPSIHSVFVILLAEPKQAAGRGPSTLLLAISLVTNV